MPRKDAALSAAEQSSDGNMSAHGVSLDRYVNVRSPIHSADARLKCGAAVLFILAVTSLPVASWEFLGAFWAGAWLSALLSRTGLARIARRSFIALPFVLVAVPSIFSIQGRVLQAWELGPVTLTPTHEGLMFVATIMLKGWIAITATVVLAATTRYLDIAAALRWYRVPSLLVAVMEMMYRYVFLLGGEVRRMLAARQARSAALPDLRPGGTVTWRAKVAGQMAGSLFIRTLNRGERVHMAMTSRGYDGGATAASMRNLTAGEAVVLAAFTAALIAAAVAARVI